VFLLKAIKQKSNFFFFVCFKQPVANSKSFATVAFLVNDDNIRHIKKQKRLFMQRKQKKKKKKVIFLAEFLFFYR